MLRGQLVRSSFCWLSRVMKLKSPSTIRRSSIARAGSPSELPTLYASASSTPANAASFDMNVEKPVQGIVAEPDIVARIERLGGQLLTIGEDNRTFFEKSTSESGQRISACLDTFLADIAPITRSASVINDRAAKFDFDAATPGNGYRSFLTVVEACYRKCLPLFRELHTKRSSPVFHKSAYVRDLEAWAQVVDSLNWLCEKLLLLHSWCKPGSLFPSEYHSAAELVENLGTFNQYCFYGRCLGFQYCPSMRRLLTFVATLLASFSEVYFHPGHPNAIQRAYIWTSRTSKYSLNPEQRAKRIINASQNCTVEFIKGFWDLNENELWHQVPRVFNSGFGRIDVNEVIQIPTERLEIEKKNGETYVVPIPTSHIGKAPVSTRLISAKVRTGMINDRSIWRRIKFTKAHSPATGLIIHCHGGGFVSHSSASQEVFLLEWASLMDMPILSIDYSLAPEAPYPRALEEVFYAYCWALKNAALLGTTAERIVFAGDSAGGNIVVGVAMKCIETGIRVPDGLFAIYTPFLVSFTPSPSRMLCLMDTLVPFPFMMRCLGAYAGHTSEDPNFSKYQSESKLPLPEFATKPKFFGHTKDDYRSDRNVFGQRLNVDRPFHVQIPADCDPAYFSQGSAEKDKYVASFVRKYQTAEEVGEDEIQVSSEAEEAITEEPEVVQRRSDSVTSQPPTTPTGVSRSFSEGGELINKEAEEHIHSAAELDTMEPESPAKEFVKFQVSRDPYIAPYLASDEVLSQMPPTSLVTCTLDPCLDDMVMFGKRLKFLKNKVTLDVIEGGLPHGFLNFARFSKEAHDGSMLSVRRIMELVKGDQDGA